MVMTPACINGKHCVSCAPVRNAIPSRGDGVMNIEQGTPNIEVNFSIRYSL